MGGEKKRWSLHQIETWAEREREFEICNVEGSLKGGKKNVEVQANLEERKKKKKKEAFRALKGGKKHE